MKTPMAEIEGACRVFRDHYDRLSAELQALEDERQALVRRRIGIIRVLVQNLAEAENLLAAHIDAAAEQFERPRTQVFHGIRVGLQKGQTVLEWDSDAMVIALIREHLAAKASTLIVRPDEYPSKAALKNLSDEQLGRVGVRQIPGADKTVIKPTDSEVDRMVSTLLKALQKDLDADTGAARAA